MVFKFKSLIVDLSKKQTKSQEDNYNGFKKCIQETKNQIKHINLLKIKSCRIGSQLMRFITNIMSSMNLL